MPFGREEHGQPNDRSVIIVLNHQYMALNNTKVEYKDRPGSRGRSPLFDGVPAPAAMTKIGAGAARKKCAIGAPRAIKKPNPVLTPAIVGAARGPVHDRHVAQRPFRAM
jgi:hypothetical protein